MGTVGIFWDYENCPPPSSETGFTTVRKIRQAIHSLGPISVFKAYVDVHLQSSKASSIKQSQLQSSGVSIIHCPHNARKEVADKTLIVDMLFFALECSGLSTIVLITGDKDFSYALSMLRSRGHMIVTICPSHSTHGDMQELADKFLYWRSEVLGIEGNGRRLSTANETCCRSSALLQIHQDFSMKGTVYPTIRPSALHEANTAGSQTVSDQNDIYIDDWDIMCSSGSSHSPDEDSLSEWGELVLDYTELDPCVQYAGPGTINPSTLSIAEVQDEGNVDVHCLKNSTRTMTLSLQQGSATISPDIKHPGFKMRAGDNLLPVDLIADSSPLLIGNACMTGAKIDPDAASFTGKMQLSPEVAQSESTIQSDGSEDYDGEHLPCVASLKWSVPCLPKAGKILDQRFSIIVDILREQRSQGKLEVCRATLSQALLSRDPLVCQKAGVDKVRKYVNFAIKAGVLTRNINSKMLTLHYDFH